MIDDATSDPEPASTNPSAIHARRCWWLRRLCSQNPFYLLSVCFVLHGIAHWYHVDSGVAFSPWPLLWITAGYTLLLAMTGFVIIRFGRVWDDARSILLIILLLFVQLSLIFDETLVSDPLTGRKLLLLCWIFSAVLSEALLRGIGIRLPWLYRLPYHGLLALLFLYPLTLAPVGTRLPNADVLWRIFLFPTVAAVLMLTLIPAIRRTSASTRENGTPWLWPWYPWSLFVFLGICICFRSYALSQSFDPVLGESTSSAMNFTSAFGVYFVVPMVFACGFLLQEIGLIENRRGTVFFSLLVPVLCLRMSIPASTASGPYFDFLNQLVNNLGSPIWLSLLLGSGFYTIAALRSIQLAELCLPITLMILTRIGPQTIDSTTLSAPQWWPLVALSVFEFGLGMWRRDSHLNLVACCAAVAALHIGTTSIEPSLAFVRHAMVPALLMIAVLLIGALFDDDFAWLLRLLGAPLLVIATACGFAIIEQSGPRPIWIAALFLVAMTLISQVYAIAMRMPLYQLSTLICGTGGSLGLIEMAAIYFIRESGWKGATSFVIGISCLALATTISCWKAGWLRRFVTWLREMLVFPLPQTASN